MQLIQVVAEEQVLQGEVQGLHVLSEWPPHSPEGHNFMQVSKLKKLGSEQLVQVVDTPVHVTQGAVQLALLQTLLMLSATVPVGHGSTHV